MSQSWNESSCSLCFFHPCPSYDMASMAVYNIPSEVQLMLYTEVQSIHFLYMLWEESIHVKQSNIVSPNMIYPPGNEHNYNYIMREYKISTTTYNLSSLYFLTRVVKLLHFHHLFWLEADLFISVSDRLLHILRHQNLSRLLQKSPRITNNFFFRLL